MHALRHAAIDEMRRRTGNIEAARQLARHASIATAEAYLHADTADLIAAMREVERGRRIVQLPFALPCGLASFDLT